MSRTATADGLGTISTAKNRVYTRAFPHEEAQTLREAGWSYEALGQHYGVSAQAIRRVCDPAVRARMDEYTQDWQRDNRTADCLGGCGRRVWLMNKGRSGYCPTCHGVLRTADSVRETELRCSKCGEWKPDDGFYRSKNKNFSRRQRKPWCITCDNAHRVALRQKNRDREHAADNARKRRAKQMSKFVVLRKTDEGLWGELDRVDAASRQHAIEKVADGEGVYAAMTEGQLRELTVKQTMAFKVSSNGSAA